MLYSMPSFTKFVLNISASFATSFVHVSGCLSPLDINPSFRLKSCYEELAEGILDGAFWTAFYADSAKYALIIFH